MISGVIPFVSQKEMMLPWKQALTCWAEVCDEIVVVMPFDDELVNDVQSFCFDLKGPNLVMGIHGVTAYSGDLRTKGYFFCDNPDWVVHFDADYLISPDDAKHLRVEIESASDDVDCLTYELAYLNRDATRLCYQANMERFFPPYNGYTADYPFVLNFRRGMRMCPYNGVDRANLAVNEETVISVGSEHFGKSLSMRWFGNLGFNGFNVSNSGVQVEHLSWSRSMEFLKKKLAFDCFVVQGVTLNGILEGQKNLNKTYLALEEAREMYPSGTE
jgi:hypothetical protein